MEPLPGQLKGQLNKLAAAAAIEEEPIEGLIGAVNAGGGSATAQPQSPTAQQEIQEAAEAPEAETEGLQHQSSNASAALLLDELAAAVAGEATHTDAAAGDFAAEAQDQHNTLITAPVEAASNEPGIGAEAAGGDSSPALQSIQGGMVIALIHNSPSADGLGIIHGENTAVPEAEPETNAAAQAAETETTATLDDTLAAATSPTAGASLLQAATPVAGADGADGISEEAIAGSCRSRSFSSMAGPLEQESSQTALLHQPSEAAQRPRLSRQLSSFFTCSSSKQPGSASRERITKQQAASKSSSPPEAGHPPLEFGAAAAELALLPRSKLLPLAKPEQALDDAAGMLGRQELPTLLTALVTLRRVAIHHHPLVSDSLADIISLLMECLHGGDVVVGQAALQTLLDLLLSFGNTTLRHCENRAVAQHSCMLGLLLAASCGRTAAVRHWANECLRHMAERLHQGRVIRLLEDYLEHPQPPVRHKAAEWLLVATYRPPDSSRLSPRRASPTTQRPPSPPVKWRE